jgi:hypothetical protein
MRVMYCVCSRYYYCKRQFSGANPGFQVRGEAYLKKLRRAEGGSKIFGVFRVKNHDFTPKKIIFFPILGGRPPGFGEITLPVEGSSWS